MKNSVVKFKYFQNYATYQITVTWNSKDVAANQLVEKKNRIIFLKPQIQNIVNKIINDTFHKIKFKVLL